MARIRGTRDNDRLEGTRGNDQVEGLGGNDVLLGLDGNDRLEGGDGDDRLEGGRGSDRLDGGAGNDLLIADTDDNEADGGAGIDKLVLDASGEARGQVFSLDGSGRGGDRIAGVQVRGIEQIDLRTGRGNDVLEGGTLADTVRAGAGNDFVIGRGGDDLLFGEAGHDWLLGNEGSDRLDGGDGSDQLFGAEGDDRLFGGSGGNFVSGGAGSDVITSAGDAIDFVDGGTGIDLYVGDRSRALTGIDFSLADPARRQALDNGTIVSNVEQADLGTGAGNDRLTGGELADRFAAARGNDRLDGRGGDDRLDGGEGDDALTGGAGHDEIAGGAGEDRATYSGRRSDYQVEALAEGRVRITDLRTGTNDGTDQVSGVESFAFSDVTLTLDELLAGRPPVANDDSAAVSEDGTIAVDLLANDSDPDGTPLAVVSLDLAGTAGIVTLGANGVASYDPGSAFQSLRVGETATDTFRYTVRDASGAESTAEVTVTITGQNDVPVLTADTVILPDDGVVVVAPLSNDVDPDEDFLEIASLDLAGVRGTVTMNTAESFRYDAGDAFKSLGAGETATEVIGYTARDPHGAVATSQVTIVINGRNDGPIANADTIAIDAGDSASGLSALLLANDVDPDAGDSFTIVSVDTTGLKGELAFDPVTKTMSYVANDPDFEDLPVGQVATTSFTYTIRDAHGATSTATATIRVAGQAEPDPGTGDDALTFWSNAYAVDVTDMVLANDGDNFPQIVGSDLFSSSGAWLQLIVPRGDEPGTPRLVYDPGDMFGDLAPGETAIDSFTYTVRDADGVETVQTVTMTIVGKGGEGWTGGFTAHVEEDRTTANLFDRLMNAAEEAVTGPIASIDIDSAGMLGTLVYDPEAQQLIYRADHPGQDFLVPDHGQLTSFRFTVHSATGEIKTGTVLLDVTGRPDAPQADADVVELDEGGNIADLWDLVLENDRDADGLDLFGITSVDTEGTLGQVTFDPQTLTLSYSAAGIEVEPGEQVIDRFDYTVTDSFGLESSATVIVVVNGTANGAVASVMTDAGADSSAAGWFEDPASPALDSHASLGQTAIVPLDMGAAFVI